MGEEKRPCAGPQAESTAQPAEESAAASASVQQGTPPMAKHFAEKKGAEPGKPHRHHRGRIVAFAVVTLAALLVFAICIAIPQTMTVEKQLADHSASLLANAAADVNNGLLSNEDTIRNFDVFRDERAQASAVYLDALPADTPPDLAAMAAESGATTLYLLDKNGGFLAGNTGEAPTADEQPMLATLLADGKPVTQQDLRYYVASVTNGWLVMAFNSVALQEETDSDQQVRLLLVDNDTEDHAQVLAINTQTGYLISQDTQLDGVRQAGTGLNTAKLTAGESALYAVGDQIYFCVGRQLTDTYLLVAVTDLGSLVMQVGYAVLVPTFMFLLVLLAVVIYALILLYGSTTAGSRYRRVLPHVFVNISCLSKLAPIAVAGLLLICLTAGYAQVLHADAHQGYNGLSALDALAEKLDENAKKVEQINTDFDQACIEQAHYAAWMVETNPTLLSDTGMQKLSDAFGTEAIYVFNGVGRVEATSTNYKSYALSLDTSDPSYKFWKILKGDANDIASDIPDPTLTKQEESTAVEALMNGNGRQRSACLAGTRRRGTAGVVRLTYATDLLSAKLDGLSPEVTIGMTDPGSESNLIIANASDQTIGYWATPLSPAVSAYSFGLADAVFQNKYIGNQNVQGSSSFVVSRAYGQVFLLLLMEKEYLLSNLRIVLSAVFYTGLGTLLLLILFAVVHLGKEPPVQVATPEEMAAERIRNDAELHNKWSGVEPLWAESTPEQKYSKVLSLLGTVGVLFVAFNAFVVNTSSESRAIAAIMRGQWLRGVNIFSITTIGMIFSFVLVGSWVTRRLLVQIGRSMGPHSETICRLLSSTIKYVAIVCTTFYSLNYLGIETKTLLASAGVLTVVIGIGAQSTVGDLLAGIFIVFEGEFRVGDIITVGDWRGTVLEIGLRTTKVEDRFKNIKVFNNATITGVVNMTQEYSFAQCNVSVDYNDSLEHVETILQEEFPIIRTRIPQIVAGPFYGGVVELGASTVVINISAQTLEADRITVERSLNRAVKLAFDRHGISIPFPQVVVNKGVDKPCPQATPEEQRRARRFVVRQSKLTAAAYAAFADVKKSGKSQEEEPSTDE